MFFISSGAACPNRKTFFYNWFYVKGCPRGDSLYCMIMWQSDQVGFQSLVTSTGGKEMWQLMTNIMSPLGIQKYSTHTLTRNSWSRIYKRFPTLSNINTFEFGIWKDTHLQFWHFTPSIFRFSAFNPIAHEWGLLGPRKHEIVSMDSQSFSSHQFAEGITLGSLKIPFMRNCKYLCWCAIRLKIPVGAGISAYQGCNMHTRDWFY